MRLTQCYNGIIKGPELWGKISQRSAGVSIFETFKSHRNQQQPALLDPTTKENISFGKLWENTCKLGYYLRKQGIGYGDVVSLCSENSVNFFTPLISGLYEGAVTAAISHTYSEKEILYCLKLVKPKIAFCSLLVYDKFLKLQRSGEIPWVKQLHIIEDLDKFGLEEIHGYEAKESPDVRSHTALILLSSGTTGLPKAVMQTHENLNARQNQAEDPRLVFHKVDSSVLVFPFYHSIGVHFALANLRQGKTVLFLPKFRERDFLKTIEDYKLPGLITVPPLCVMLAKSPTVDEYNLESVKEIICGGAPLSYEVERGVKERLPTLDRLTQVYGQTEVCLTVIAYGAEDAPRLGSTGRVIAGQEVIVRNPDNGEHLNEMQLGELCYKGPVVMKGYFENEKATRETFTEDGWLRSGDVGYYDEDEYFYIVDRLKELIKYKAFQVPPAELEALLMTYEGIRDAAVVGLPDEACGELPVAFVVLSSDSTATDTDIIQFIAKNVSNAKRLHHVWFVSEIPRTATGKILRKDLRQLAIDKQSGNIPNM